MSDPNSFFHFDYKGLGRKWSPPKKDDRGLGEVSDKEESGEMRRYFADFRHFLPFYISVLVVFVVLFFQLFNLQILKASQYREKADTHSLREEIIKAPRGLIYDRNKKILAKNIPSFQVVIVPSDLPKDEQQKEEVIAKLADILKIKVSKIKELLEKYQGYTLEPVLIEENLDYETALIVESQFDQFSGVVLKKDPTREYLSGSNFAHLLGYVSRIDKEEYEQKKDQGYLINDLVGKTGLEFAYERELRGQDGKQILEVDAANRIVRRLGSALEPVPGQNLVLSIDSDLQKKMYQALSKGAASVGQKKAAAVAMDPQTGEILALVSLPSFDNNLFSKGISSERYSQLSNDPSQPLFNRVISGTYPTGSSIKPVIASAALEEGIITSSTQIYDPGAITVPNQYHSNIVYTFPCWNRSGHGYLNVVGAIAHSCNVFFYTVGGGYKEFPGLGPEKIARYMKIFGLGAQTGIDLPGETAGLVPTPEWKKETIGEHWYIGDTYLLSIGQTNLLATPLQVANYTAAIANGGILYKPRVVHQILSANGDIVKDFPPQVVRKNFITQSHLQVVREGMRQAVQSGSAQILKFLPVEAAGKTGTAQFGPRNEKSHAWFTCFAPYKNPKIALTIIVEGGGEGSAVSLPIAKEILQYYFSR